RRELSWTRIFNELEKMMPAHLRVLSVQPKAQQDQIEISLQLGGDSRERAAQLVRRMEKSKMFSSPQFVSEGDQQAAARTQDQAPKHFTVQAEYVPINEQPTGSRTEIASEGGK